VTLFEAAVLAATVCGILAYILPVILWTRARPNFPVETLALPALMVGSWLGAEYFGIGPTKVGFTFLGALPVAIMSNVLLLVLVRTLRRGTYDRALWAVGVVVVSIVSGVAARVLLPALAD
jgi:hypothetical protein